MSFLAPLFLLAALAGAVPVVLHMIHHHKAQEVRFSTLRFLRVSVQRTRRRKYLDDVALLAARVAVLVLLALGLARPVLTGIKALWGGGRSTAVVIVLDNSASMALEDGGRPRLEAARAAAGQVLDALRDGDAVALLPTGGPPSPELGKLHHRHDAVRQALAACRVSYERADLAGKLRQARELLAAADVPNREIYVLTDNQALSWSGLQADGEQPDSKAREAPVIVVNVNHDPSPNVALRSVRLESPALAVGVPILAVVEAVNHAPVPQQRELELYVDGTKVETSPTLNLPPLGTVRHAFRFTLDRAGAHRGEVRLAEEDGSALDNRLFFAVSLDQQAPVAIVKPRRREVSFVEDTYYLERVLAPAGGEVWSLRTTVLSPADLATESLSAYSVIFCVNLPAPEPAVAERLRAYVAAGGRLFWACGDNVQADAYNRMNEQAGGALLPAALGPARDAAALKRESWPVGSLDRDHPALAPLTEPASLYQSVLVHRHFPLTVAAESGARVLARLADDQPLLVERASGAGSVLLLGTALHVEWTNLPLRPVFLPLMVRLTFGLAGVEAGRSSVVAGTPLAVPLRGQSGPAEVEIVRPSGEVLRVQSPEDGGPGFRYADTHEAGAYLVRLGGPKQRRQYAFAVNLDPDECDATAVSREELAGRFGRWPVVFCDEPEELVATVRRLREGRSLWGVFLAAVLVGLLVEAYLANCRGRKPAAGSAPATRGPQGDRRARAIPS